LICIFLIFILILFKGSLVIEKILYIFKKNSLLKIKVVSLIFQKIKEFNLNLSKIRSSRQYIPVMLISILIWIMQIIFIFSLFNSFNINLNLVEVIIATVFVSGVFILPLPSIMNLGTYEIALVLAFTSLGIALDEAISYSLSVHALYILLFSSVGLYGFLRLNLWKN